MHEKVQLDEGFLEVHCKATRRLLERKSCNFAWIIVIIIIITLNLELSIDFFKKNYLFIYLIILCFSCAHILRHI